MVCDNPAPGAHIQCTCCTKIATGRSEAGSYPLAGGSHIARQGNQKHVDEASKPRITFCIGDTPSRLEALVASILSVICRLENLPELNSD